MLVVLRDLSAEEFGGVSDLFTELNTCFTVRDVYGVRVAGETMWWGGEVFLEERGYSPLLNDLRAEARRLVREAELVRDYEVLATSPWREGVERRSIYLIVRSSWNPRVYEFKSWDVNVRTLRKKPLVMRGAPIVAVRVDGKYVLRSIHPVSLFATVYTPLPRVLYLEDEDAVKLRELGLATGVNP